MHTSIISTRKTKNKSHPKIVLNILAVGWGSEDTSNFFVSFFILLVVFRHLILTLSYVLLADQVSMEKEKRENN